MAERKGQQSGNSKNNDKKDDENRESAENAPNAPPIRDNSEHKSAQTDTTEVRHVGIQFESLPPRDEEETQRKTYNQNLHSQMNNLSVAENQLAAWSSVFKNKGPTQFGESNSIVKNPTYNITNHNHYTIHCQPSSHHGNNQPCHIPCQCQECIQSYVNQHMPLTDHPRHHPESESRHLGLPHHPVPQLLPSPQQIEQMESTESRGNNTSQPETQQVNHSQQMESTESRGNGTSRSQRGHVNHSQQMASTESRANGTSRPERGHVSHAKEMASTESRGNGTSRPERGHVSHSQQMASKESKGNGTSRSERGHVNRPQQMASTESGGNGTSRSERRHVNQAKQKTVTENHSKRPTTDQSSSPSRRLPPSDVIHHATRTERERAESETVNPEGGDSKKINQSQPTQNAGSRSPSVSVTRDTVSIIDSKGKVLEPGDVLWTKGPGYLTTGIYVGQQMLVRCDWRTGNNMVKKEELCMTAPFGKYTVYRKGECQVFSPRQIVERATSWIGEEFTDGDNWIGLDFPVWVYTGLGWNEADRKGFGLVW